VGDDPPTVRQYSEEPQVYDECGHPVLAQCSGFGGSEGPSNDRRIGVPNIDTTLSLTEARWLEPEMRPELARRLFNWAKILARLLSV
jgi:hypothetical protein